MSELPTIPQFYSKKNIFITGGSGFIGKVLVEKLLRSCPGVNNIYLLLREKKGQSPEDRVKAITDLPLFDLVRTQNPRSLSKVKAISGDVTELGLGLSPEDRNLLVHEVNVVFHAAASVRFDDSLTDAILLNTRGTREVCQLALEMKSLKVLVHVSTTYCNCDKKVIEERLYPAHADWRKTIEIAETVDRHTLNVLTEKYMHPLPNTYTFTKSLGEHVVHDLCEGKIPVVVYRPSIIISTAYEPFPGWIDNFNGPMGLLIACGKGIVRTVYTNPKTVADYVPVDMTVRAILISSWKQALIKDDTQRLTPNFYNGSNNDIQPITMDYVVELGKQICEDVPFDDVLWYPRGNATACYHWFFVKMVLFQLVPALLVDGLLKAMGKKPMLMKIQRRIYVAIAALVYFLNNQWKFINDKVFGLQYELLPSDVDAFAYKEDEIDNYEYFKNATMGARKYLLKEGDDLEKAKKHSQRMWLVAVVFDILWYLGLFWLVFVKFDAVSVAANILNRFFSYLTTD